MRRLLVLLLTAAPAMAQTPVDGAADAGAGGAPAAYTVVNAGAIPDPLTDAPGDSARGAAVWAAHCEGCHAQGAGSAPDDPARRGEIGALRLAVVNLGIARPEVEGHAFHDLGDDPDATVDPVLSAQAVEDVVAWLARPAR